MSLWPDSWGLELIFFSQRVTVTTIISRSARGTQEVATVASSFMAWWGCISLSNVLGFFIMPLSGVQIIIFNQPLLVKLQWV